MIIKCNCEHKFQDKEYGKGKRLATPTSKSKTEIIWRCTVCGKEGGSKA